MKLDTKNSTAFCRKLQNLMTNQDVLRLVLTSYTHWQPLTPSRTTLSMDAQFDVIVLGTGLTESIAAA